MPRNRPRGSRGGARGGVRGGARGGRGGRGGGGGRSRGSGVVDLDDPSYHTWAPYSRNGDFDDDFISLSAGNNRRQERTQHIKPDRKQGNKSNRGKRGGGGGGGGPGAVYQMIQASKQGGQHNHHGSGGSSASHRGNSRKRGQPVEIKFSRATERVNHSMSLQGDDSDEDSDLDDLGSDGDDGSEDGYFMEGEFEWEEADRDPALKQKKAIQEAKVEREPYVPLTSWGGALTYQTQHARSESDEATSTSSANRQIDNVMLLEAASFSATSDGPHALSSTLSQALDHRPKKPKMTLDLTDEIDARMKTAQIRVQATAVTAEESNVTEIEDSSMWVMDTTPSLPEAESEAPVMWVIDTAPTEIKVEEAPPPEETYIDLPPEQEWSKKPKKANRSKRGGRKLKEKERLQKLARRVAAGDQEDGMLLLEEPESEEDDDMQALQDYLMNTTDPDNPDQFDQILGSLRGLHAGFGHSNDIGGLDPDDSDFDQGGSEDDSQDGGDHDDMDFAPGYMPRSSKSGPVFYDSDEIMSSSAMGGRKKKGKNSPHGGNFETLSELNKAIEDFVRDEPRQLQLPPMPKTLRRKVHLLAETYNLRSQSLGSGKKRSPMLVKTHQTRMPPNPVNIHKLLNQSEQELKKISIQRRMDKQGGGGGRGPRGGRDGNPGSRPVHGTVVGAEASAISIENKGHRMLAKMGWSPGVGLGATGEGITQPIEAIMRARRRGLGHE
ncbi:hypothetical protein BGZ74_001666 [Mortierella antarctica]|nr:hypothetical protein BGZ74_001666 [Mortierella antarctica]